MTRRDFILSAALAGAPGLAHASAPTAPTAPIPAIDTHIHLYDPRRAQGIPWPPKTDPLLYKPHLPEDFRKTSAPFHVVGAVVVEASDWLEDNAWLLDLAKTNDEIVGIVGNLRIDQPGFADQLRRFAANPLFRGLRLKSSDLKTIDAPASASGIRLLAEAGLTVDVLGGPAILAPAVRLARLAPALRIVVDHLPFKDWDGNLPALRAALGEVAAQPNIFIKVSEVVRRPSGGPPITDPAYYRPTLDALLDLFGPDRVLFASNWPVSDRVAPYGTVHRVVADYFLARGRATAEKFFWRNSLVAYRWQARGAAALLT